MTSPESPKDQMTCSKRHNSQSKGPGFEFRSMSKSQVLSIFLRNIFLGSEGRSLIYIKSHSNSAYKERFWCLLATVTVVPAVFFCSGTHLYIADVLKTLWRPSTVVSASVHYKDTDPSAEGTISQCLQSSQVSKWNCSSWIISVKKPCSTLHQKRRMVL